MGYATTPPLGQEPILADLAKIGFVVRELAELAQSGINYREAIPVLLEWLPRVNDKKVKEWVVRALSVPWAKPEAVRPLLEEFRTYDPSLDWPDGGTRWVIGNALWVIADDSYFEDIVELVLDPKYGMSRGMLVLKLGKSKKPEASEVLFSLLDDPDVGGEATEALSKKRLKINRTSLEAALPALTRKLDDWRPDVRNAAKKVIARLDDEA